MLNCPTAEDSTVTPPPLTVTMVTPAPSTPPVCYHGNPRPFSIMLFLCCGRFCSSFTVRVETSTFIIKQPPEGKAHPESVLTRRRPPHTHTHTPVICEHALFSRINPHPHCLRDSRSALTAGNSLSCRCYVMTPEVRPVTVLLLNIVKSLFH